MRRLLVAGALVAVIGIAWLAVSAGDRGAHVALPEGAAVATFAGGCFWCIEADFERVPGVIEAVSGYTGGELADPSYKQVSSGTTGHIEAVEVYYDPNLISYEGLLAAYWRMFDPTDAGGSFADRGQQYTSAIFYRDEAQRRIAEQSRQALAASGRYAEPIVTPIQPAQTFYRAEDYHQDYYERNPLRYRFYRRNSGRDQYLEETWGEAISVNYTEYSPAAGDFNKPSDEQLRETLTPLQYKVTQRDGTEPPFDNAYWDNKRDGIYVDVVSGEPLFSSTDKFKSGTGWPSFTKPLEDELIVEKQDYKLLLPRTEVRSRYADSHLGHVFNDGPEPTGLRYCINSAALRFVPKEDLAQEGYDRYLGLFD